VVFSVNVWRTVSLMWTVTKSVKGDRIMLYKFWEQIMWCVCVNVVFSVTVWRTERLMWNGSEYFNGDMIVLNN
jgi:hypothetical protein